MAISYPVSPPNNNFESIRWTLRNAKARVESPFTLQTQTYQHAGYRWEAEVKLPPLTYSDATAWQGFFAQVAWSAGEGTFKLFDTTQARLSTQSSTDADALFQLSGTSNDSGDSSVTLKNVGTSDAETINQGEKFTIYSSGATDRGHLYMVAETTSFPSPNTGVAVAIVPPLRSGTFSNNGTVDTTTPHCIMQLTDPNISWDINKAMIYGFTFACVEADL